MHGIHTILPVGKKVGVFCRNKRPFFGDPDVLSLTPSWISPACPVLFQLSAFSLWRPALGKVSKSWAWTLGVTLKD